jgi:hypothetical protein
MRWFVLNRFAGLWFVVRFAHEHFCAGCFLPDCNPLGEPFGWSP